MLLVLVLRHLQWWMCIVAGCLTNSLNVLLDGTAVQSGRIWGQEHCSCCFKLAGEQLVRSFAIGLHMTYRVYNGSLVSFSHLAADTVIQLVKYAGLSWQKVTGRKKEPGWCNIGFRTTLEWQLLYQQLHYVIRALLGFTPEHLALYFATWDQLACILPAINHVLDVWLC